MGCFECKKYQINLCSLIFELRSWIRENFDDREDYEDEKTQMYDRGINFLKQSLEYLSNDCLRFEQGDSKETERLKGMVCL